MGEDFIVGEDGGLGVEDLESLGKWNSSESMGE